MKQTPFWEASSHSASQEIPPFLNNQKVHYRVHNSPSVICALSQMHPDHIFSSHLPKYHSNIILPYTYYAVY